MRTLVLAVVAALLASAATATAARTGLIGSAQIRDGSIRLVDLTPQARRALKGQRGPAGSFDPYMVRYVLSDFATLAPGAYMTVTSGCPEGGALVGGGHTVRPGSDGQWPVPGVSILASAPSQGPYGSGPHRYWIVNAHNPSGVQAGVAAWAICAMGGR